VPCNKAGEGQAAGELLGHNHTSSEEVVEGRLTGEQTSASITGVPLRTGPARQVRGRLQVKSRDRTTEVLKR
jgi:hypothetical protein